MLCIKHSRVQQLSLTLGTDLVLGVVGFPATYKCHVGLEVQGDLHWPVDLPSRYSHSRGHHVTPTNLASKGSTDAPH